MAHAPKWISAKGNEPVTEVAARSLKSRLEPVARLLPLAALKSDEDIEYVLHLRVWTRRADTAVEMYRDFLPKWRAAWIEKQLARIRQATSDARDDDVFARRLSKDKSPDAAALLKRVGEHRSESQQAIRDVYERMTKKKGRFDRRIGKLLKRVRVRGKRKKSKEPTFRDWAEDHLRPVLDEFFTMAEGDLQDIDRLHQFRIAGKRLRYAMELLSAAFDSELQKNAYPLIESLQDQLGKVNDHASAMNRIGRWIDENEDTARAEYLNEMLNRERTQLEESRREFSAWWTAERRNEIRQAFDRALSESQVTDSST